MLQRAALQAALAITLIVGAMPAALAFQSAADGYAIDFPARWQLRENMMGTKVIGLSPLDNATDTFSENVNVVIEDFSDPVALNAYTQASLQGLAGVLNQYKLIENKAVKLGGHEARRLVYDHTQGAYKLRAMVYLLIVGQKGYVVTCTAEQARYAKYQAPFEAICKTFKLIESLPVLTPTPAEPTPSGGPAPSDAPDAGAW